MSNSVDPDETAEPSHLDLRCLQKPILSPMAEDSSWPTAYMSE